MFTLTIVAAAAALVPGNPALTPTLGQASGPKFDRRKTMWDTRAVALAGKPASSLFAACLENGKVRIIDAAGKVAGPTLTGHNQAAYAVAWSPDGKYIVSGDEQARILMWDAKSGKMMKEFKRDRGHTRGIQSISFAPDGKSFVSVGKDDAICVWATAGSHPLWKVVGEPANFYGAQFSPTGSIITGTQVEGIRYYLTKNGSLAAKLTLPGGQGANGFVMNQEGTLGATAGRDSVVTLWDLKNKKRIAALKGHSDFVVNEAMTPNGRFLATSGVDAKVIIWDLKSYKNVATLDNMSYVGSPIAFTGDGNFMIVCNSSDNVEVHSITPSQKKAAAPSPRRRRG